MTTEHHLNPSGALARALVHIADITQITTTRLIDYREIKAATGAEHRRDPEYRKQVMQRLERWGLVAAAGDLYSITAAGLREVLRLQAETAIQREALARQQQEQAHRERVARQRQEIERITAGMAEARVSGRRQGYVAGGAAQLPDPPRRSGLQHEALPSRRGNKLHYRDGRVEDISSTVHALPCQRALRPRACDLQTQPDQPLPVAARQRAAA